MADVYDSTIAELIDIVTIYRETETRDYRDRWEQTRVLAEHIIAPYAKKNTQHKRVFALPWDREVDRETREIPEVTPEQLAAFQKRAAAYQKVPKKDRKYIGSFTELLTVEK